MTRPKQLVQLTKIRLDATAPLPLSRQFEQQLKNLIQANELRAGMRLPSTRQIAEMLGCSRGTVVGALEQLAAEGFIDSSQRVGTFVTKNLGPGNRSNRSLNQTGAGARRRLSKIGEYLADVRRPVYRPGTPFSTGSPDIEDFPFDIWSRLSRSVWRKPPRDAVYNQDPAGYMPLRRAISSYLHDTRGTKFEPANVMITSGSQQALDLVARLLLNEGDHVWIEEPGFLEAAHSIKTVRATIVPVPVDSDGLSVVEGIRNSPNARLAIVTPSHQYPLGMIMTYSRRLELLEWARRANAWILEDDYDSEARHVGTPLPALQALDVAGNVIYVGTFSKALFSAMRVGYVVLPSELTERFSRARYSIDPFTSMMIQPVLSRFIEEGHFSRYIHKIRRKYSARREHIVSFGKAYFGDAIEFSGDRAGIHVTAIFSSEMTRRVSDQQAARKAFDQGIIVTPLSYYFQDTPTQQGLIMGFGSTREKDIEVGMKKLCELLL